MPDYALKIQSLGELDEHSNYRTDTITVTADSLEAARTMAPAGWVPISVGEILFTEQQPTQPLDASELPGAVHKIAGRIRVEADVEDEMDYIIESAANLATESPIVWVEIQYRDPITGEWDDWDEVGDALEIDFSGGTEDPEIRTLTSEEWKAASE